MADAIHRCSIKQAACDLKQLVQTPGTFWYTAVLTNAPSGEKEVDAVVMNWITQDIWHATKAGGHPFSMMMQKEGGDKVLHVYSLHPRHPEYAS